MADRACLALLLGLMVAACNWVGQGESTAQATPQSSALNAVPLNLPRLQSGQSCPLSKPTQIDPQFAMGLGSGPVYLTNGELVRSDAAHPQKVAWFANPSYSGPIRIRGGRIDGGGQLLLGGRNYGRGAPVKTVEGTTLYSELDYPDTNASNSPSGWRIWPSFTYIATPGCYAWQVDGLRFSELITIQALQLPVVLPGIDPCPVSPQQMGHNLSSEFGSGPAVGSGPIYALMGEMRDGVLGYSTSYSQSHHKDGWAYSKVLWMANPEVSGSVLIRGRQIDGTNAIGFGMGDDPVFEIKWEIASGRRWASLPSETRIRAPGCYAYQVDSQKGTEVIAFRVVGIA
jgi:hypothetical protein